MGWVAVKITVDGSNWLGHKNLGQSGISFSVPFVSGLSVGDTLTVDGKSYSAVTVTDLNNRNETLLVEAKESEDDKPTSRGSKRKPSGADVQDQA